MSFNTTSDNSNVNQLYIRESDFIINTEIIKSTGTTPYLIGNLINNNLATSLPSFDFSSLGTVGGKLLTIKSIIITSNNGFSIPMLPIIYFYNDANLIGSSLIDNTYFNPTYDETKLKLVATIEPQFSSLTNTNNIYHIFQNEIIRIGKLTPTGKIYFCLVNQRKYTPKSNEKIYITIKGTLN